MLAAGALVGLLLVTSLALLVYHNFCKAPSSPVYPGPAPQPKNKPKPAGAAGGPQPDGLQGSTPPAAAGLPDKPGQVRTCDLVGPAASSQE